MRTSDVDSATFLTMMAISFQTALFLFCGTSKQPRVSSLNEKGPHRLTSLSALAWLASWVDITVYWVALGLGGQ